MERRLKAFRFAFNGLTIFFSETFHARIHFFAALVVCFFGFYLQVSKVEWIALILCMTLVFITEALNSALEYVVDLATIEIHPLAKKAKDVAAAAVLLAAAFSSIIAAIIFIPYF